MPDRWTQEIEDAYDQGRRDGIAMTEPTPNADEALAAKWLKSIGGASSIIAAVLGWAAGMLTAVFTGFNI